MSGQDVVARAIRLARDHVKEAEKSVDRKPSDAKKEAGTYRKGHLTWNGLNITIENPKGSTRSGVGPTGKPWSVVMPATYGYIKRSLGADDDHVDLYIGPNPLSQQVWIIDQVDARTGRFDEHKVLAGFDTKDDALATYRKAFSDGKAEDRIGGVTKMGVGQFKRWLLRSDTTQPLTM